MPDSPDRRPRVTPVPGVFGPDEAEPADAGPLPEAELSDSEVTDADLPERPDASAAPPSRPAPASTAAGWLGEDETPPGPPHTRADRPSSPVLPPRGGTRSPTAPPAAPEAGPSAPLDAHVVSETVRPTEAELIQEAKAATRDRARDVADLLVTYGKAHLPERTPRPPAAPEAPPKLKGRLGQVLPFLQLVPYVLGLVFAASFVWDFPDRALVLGGLTIPLDGLLRVLSVSGLIGFLTNWLAITMLFQPREKRAIVPQGLIPAQRERVIYRLSEAISKELINAEIIKQKIQASGAIPKYRDVALGVVRGVVEDPGFRADLRGIAGGYVRDVLRRPDLRRELTRLAAEKLEEGAGAGLGGAVLRLYRSVAEDDFQRRIDRALDEIPGAVEPLLDRIDTALDAIPPKIEARSADIEALATDAVLGFVEQLDIRSMIVEKARGFDESQLENLLKSTSNEQLNYIKYLGAVLGVFGGLVIWQAGALVVFVALALLVWGVDEALVRARRAREASGGAA